MLMTQLKVEVKSQAQDRLVAGQGPGGIPQCIHPAGVSLLALPDPLIHAVPGKLVWGDFCPWLTF